MKLSLRLLVFMLFCLCNPTFSQAKYTYNDGPYIKYFSDSIEILWIEEGKLNVDRIQKNEPYGFSHDSLTSFSIQDLHIEKDSESYYPNVEKFVAISDIHGQFELFVDLLQAHGVVSELNEWTYGNGHLVIVGDVMDRGPKVIESLWYIYHLEQLARNAGGKVHLLLGNHEIMVINGNLGYLNNKYKYTSGITSTFYNEFFNQDTFFGKWLSSKKIAVSINDVVFVHGGFSESISTLNKPIEELNGIFQNKLMFHSSGEIESDSLLSMLYFENGPLWYRGYAFPSEFDTKRAKAILKTLNKDRIVVGHTSMPEIKGLYDNRIILVDSNIKFGKTGQVLICENDTLYKGKLDGSKEWLISEENKPDSVSIFTKIFEDSSPVIRLATAIKTVYKNDEDTYEESVLYYFHNGLPLSFNIGIKTSGNMRRKICSKPPLKINFKKKELKAFGFTSSDKFKILMPCRSGATAEEQLKEEHLIYELYRIVDSIGLQSKLAEVIIEDDNKSPKSNLGLIIEDKNHFEDRTKIRLVKEGIIRKQTFDRIDFLTFCLFQFIIANPDWALTTRHNLIAIKKPDKNLLSLVPYDFDYCGFIHTDYAVPHESLPIESVTERYFMDKSATMAELEPILVEFLKKEEKIIDHCKGIDYLNEKAKARAVKFLEKSFSILKDRKKAKKALGL